MSGRPGTGNRPGSSMTGMGAPPGTGMRLGTAAMGYSNSVIGDVNISDRPVTNQGVMGMRMKTGGPGRQVMDATYFSALIRAKNTEITAEIRNLNIKIEQHHRDVSTHATLERQYEELFQSVRDLEGTLADFNLAMDKNRSGTDPEEIENYRLRVKANNAEEAKQADKIFLLRSEKEKEVDEIENQINNIYRENESRINTLEPGTKDHYHKLMEENTMYRKEFDQCMGQLDNINEKIHGYEDELARDKIRDEYSAMEKQLIRLRKDRENLEEEIDASRLDPKTAREQLIAKVKNDSTRLKELDMEVNKTQEENTRLRRHIVDLENNINNKGGENADAKKYEVLFKRDQEMSEFIDKFDATHSNELEEQAAVETNIVDLLEHLSIQVNKESSMPSKAEFEEMKNDLTFKEQQMKSSATTQVRLKEELKKRNEELEKINLLDGKITKELATLNEKNQLMKSEMIEFDQIDSLREKAEATKGNLVNMKQSYVFRRDSIKQQVAGISSKYEKVKQGLLSNETAKSLDVLEQKLRNYEQNIFTLNEYVETKGRETDYEGLRETCFGVMDDLNDLIIKNQTYNPTY